MSRKPGRSSLLPIRRPSLPQTGSSCPARARCPTACASSAKAARRTKPFLGICIGLQMLFERGEEGDTPGLGILAGAVPRLRVPQGLKVPHMGWNEVMQAYPHPLWAGIQDRSRFYFVHSYFPAPTARSLVAATCMYGAPFTCAVARDNIFAVQFHPEKSQSAGLQLLSNFVRWRP
jgi:imidazole glycerol-phosphate synthase subunit HisH